MNDATRRRHQQIRDAKLIGKLAASAPISMMLYRIARTVLATPPSFESEHPDSQANRHDRCPGLIA